VRALYPHGVPPEVNKKTLLYEVADYLRADASKIERTFFRALKELPEPPPQGANVVTLETDDKGGTVIKWWHVFRKPI
jgi:hypothetical protein